MNPRQKTFGKSALFAVLGAFMISCASTHPGLMADLPDTPAYKSLLVSTNFRDDLSDKNNFYYEFTFENKDQKWIRVDEAEIVFPFDDGGPYNVVVGKDLEAWAKSLKLKSEQEDFNTGILTAGSVLAGLAMAAVGVSRTDQGLVTAGAVVAGTGAGYAGVKDFTKSRRQTEGALMVPDEHLMAPFIIPSNGLVRKWILLSVPSGKISKNANLRLKTIDGDDVHIRLKFF